MYPLMIRRFIVVTTTPFKSLKFSSASSEIKEKPVIAFFENHGFSKSQISEIVKKLPCVLSDKPEKSLLPKLLFFQSKGLSSPEVADLVTAYPNILKQSLNQHIIPTFDYFQDLFQSEEKTIAAIKRSVFLLNVDLRCSLRPNIEVMRQTGVPLTNIQAILATHPRLFSSNPFRFKEILGEVKEMGFNPLRYTFALAVVVLQQMSKSTWEKKVEIYRKWGYSKEDVLTAFGKHPVCMKASEDKINAVMDYFVNTMGCESSFITKNPSLLCYSLKRRIVPRGSVFLVLSSEGLIKKDVNVRLFSVSEKRFVDKFIEPYEKHIPELLKLYEEKLKVSGSDEV